MNKLMYNTDRNGFFVMKKEHLITTAVLLILWQTAAICVHNDILIPSPMQTMSWLFSSLQSAKFYSAVGASVYRIMGGWLISMAAALVLSIICYLVPVFARLFEPLQILTRTIPNVSYIIIDLIWLGSEGAVRLVCFLILFPIFMNGFMNALQRESRDTRDAEAIYPETVPERIRKRILPELGAEIFSTGKTAASMGFKVGVMAEILGSVQNGIGRSINFCRLDLNTAGILGWTIVLIVLAACIDTLFGKINNIVKEEQGWKD
jgi:NitT/TauT family transport system permease protein